MYQKLKLLIIPFMLLLAFSVTYACENDCMKCHPVLMKSGSLDNNHKVLDTCIECHKVTSNNFEKMGSMCGQDCWQCHSVKKVMKVKNKSHMALDTCISCHISLEKDKLLNNDQASSLESLIKQY